jgi:hypothetical protein
MRPETKSRLNGLIRRERIRYAAWLLGCILPFLAFGSFWLEPWETGSSQIGIVISYDGNEAGGYRSANDGLSRAIITLADGSEGVVDVPQPRSLAIGERLIVKEQTSSIFGRRRFIFVNREK